MTTIVTLDHVMESTVRHTAHLDGPRGKGGWFGDMHTCVQFPRLQRMTKCIRADRSTHVTWWVDGVEVGVLTDAVAALNVPPVLTPDEEAALERVTDEPQDMRGLLPFEIYLGLRNKGFIQSEAGKTWRRRG